MRPFTYYLRVRYGECDAQKVVFNSRYGDYVDVAVNEFLRALGYESQLFSGELDFQLVKQTTEWRGPARFDQVLAASVDASRIGTTSFAFTTEFRIAGDDRVICTVETVYVMVDTHTLAKKPIPDDMRTAFERGAPGIVTDHAGYRQV
jgi:acyl-CoA thioester hydrolase